MRFGRTVVIDPRQRSVGIGIFRNGEIVDCHVYNADRNRIIPYLVRLLDEHRPDGVLVPETEDSGTRDRGGVAKRIIRGFLREAQKRCIGTHRISRRDIRTWLMRSGQPIRNAQEANREVIRRYPELTTMFPAPRQAWEPEQYFTPLFNVAAMYIAWVRKLSNTPMA